MKVSDLGIEFIKREEGVRLTAYRDVAGVLTIGVGHVIQEDDDIALTITEREADALLREDLVEAEHAVNTLVKVGLEQHKFDSVTSWCFNLGYGNLKRSTLLKKLNARDYAAVPAQIKRWVYAGDQDGDGDVDFDDRVKGLVKRREREARLFAEGDYGLG